MRRLSSNVLAFVATAVAAPAFAESGTFEFVNGFTTHFATFDHGTETLIGGPIDGTLSIYASSGGIFNVGDGMTMDCLVIVKKMANGIDNESNCTWADAAQDKMFTRSRRRAGDMSTGGQGKVEILNGTGKYSGVTGTCTYRVTYLPGNRATSISKCEWQKP